ncbi:MAG: DUF3158 family protein [Sulfitobacter sp.]|nr:DUF3158 family protein [Sulfitobacter sp.]
MSKLDLQKPGDLGRFFAVHHTCFRALAAHHAYSGLAQMIGALERDLHHLGAPVLPDARLQPVDPLAVAYIIEGSRMGSKVLRSRWKRSTDPTVQGASAYFSLKPDGQRWRDLCAALSVFDTRSSRAALIVSDTVVIFELFTHICETSAQAQLLR